MDPITHALIGALLAVLSGVHQRYGLAGTAALVLASLAPDLDALSVILGQKYYLLYHRVLFHSLGGAFLLGLGLSAALYLFTPLKDFRLVLVLSLAGVLLHLAIDLLSSWKIPLLSPFSLHRSSLDLVWFINLPILLVTIGALLWARAEPRNARLIACAALALVAAYVAFRFYQQRTVASFMQHNVLSQDSSALVGVLPSQMEFFTWHAVVRQEGGYTVYNVHFCLIPQRMRTLSGGTGGTRILSSLSVPTSPDGKIVAASQEAKLVKAFLENARFPVAFVKKWGNGYQVEWQDVHLMLAGGVVRGVVVYVDADGHVIREWPKLKPELESLDPYRFAGEKP